MLPFWDFGPSFLVDLGVFWQKWFSQSCLFGMMKFSFVGSPIQIWAFSPDSAGTGATCVSVGSYYRAVFGKTYFPMIAFYGVSELILL